jgi:hypothetical protein
VTCLDSLKKASNIEISPSSYGILLLTDAKEGGFFMDQKFVQQFDGLLEKYTELLLGESDADKKAKVQMWALYTYISKSMPALAKHWNEKYPEAKEEMKDIIAEIRELNEDFRKSKEENSD